MTVAAAPAAQELASTKQAANYCSSNTSWSSDAGFRFFFDLPAILPAGVGRVSESRAGIGRRAAQASAHTKTTAIPNQMQPAAIRNVRMTYAFFSPSEWRSGF